MSTLASLLRCLARSDISEVRLQSDAAAAAATLAGNFTPLTRTPLTTAQIGRILDGTSVAGVLANLTSGGESQVGLQIESQHFTVRVMRQDDRIQVRFFRAEASAPDVAEAASPPEPEVSPRRGSSTAASAVPAGVAQFLVGAIGKVENAASVAPALENTPPAGSWRPSAGPVSTLGRASNAAVNPVTDLFESPTADNAAARQYLAAVLAAARQQQASDVHVTANGPLRVRRHGELVAEGEPLAAEQVASMLLPLLTAMQRAELEAHGYADFAFRLPQAGRLRVNISQQANGLKGCFRLVADTVPTLASLGLPKELEAVAHYHQGLAVISGPNGQGKTTTLAAIVNLINMTAPHHIITVEDPVEIVHPVGRAVLSQREVGTHTKSFARALKASLREDPDVIVIGELRDRETVEIALSAAETGHLVIATMSTRSAAKTIDRLIDLFPPDEQPQIRATLAGALKIIVSQRLVPAIGGGMTAAVELITGSVPLWSLIRDNKLFQLPTLQQRGRSLGMIKFDTSLQELVQARKITLETAKKVAENVVELERNLSLAGAAAPPKGT